MKICIHANGGNKIGMGHIMRTLVLADELSKYHDVFYACLVDDPLSDKYRSGIEKVLSNGYRIEYIDERFKEQQVKVIQADCLITDSYDVSESYFKTMKRHFPISGCLDDEMICSYFDVDFLINQNIYATVFNYKVNKNTKLMLSSQYAILRKEFRNSPRKKISNNVKNIFVTLGGSDDQDLTTKVVSVCKELQGPIKLEVVVGAAFANKDKLFRLEDQYTSLHYEANMSKLMTDCDIAVSSCGTTLYELAAMGVPTVGLIVAENQELAGEVFNQEGFIKSSNLSTLNCDILEMFSVSKRKSMSERFQKLVDGLGYRRISEIINELLDNI